MKNESFYNLSFNLMMALIPAILVFFSDYMAFTVFVFFVVFLLQRIADLLMELRK